MLYLALRHIAWDSYGTATRFPVADQGSDIPSKLRLDTTLKSKTVDVTIDGKNSMVKDMPSINNTWIEAVNISYAAWSGLGLDQDGDTLSTNGVMSEEAIEDIKKNLNSISSLIRPNGTPLREASDYISEIFQKTLTR